MKENNDLSTFIQENFGSNATYVEGLLDRYRSDPKLVDDAWQDYFGDLLNGKTPADAASAAPKPSVVAAPIAEVATTPKPPVVVPLSADTTTRAITGPAKKIVENMESSLTVPTATSFRTIPVKILEENRLAPRTSGCKPRDRYRHREKGRLTHFARTQYQGRR